MAVVKIKGVITSNDQLWVYDYFGVDATSPKKVENEMKEADGEALEVEISSPGGDVFAGSEIYTALKSYEGYVTVKIVSVAASAASVIAMAGDKILMSPTAQMMLHNVSVSNVSGDYRDIEHMATRLKTANNSIANAYRLKSGISQQELLILMDKETWLSAEQAIRYSLADGIMFEKTANSKEEAQHRLSKLKTKTI